MGRGGTNTNPLYGEFEAPRREGSPLADLPALERTLDLSIIDDDGSAVGYTLFSKKRKAIYVEGFATPSAYYVSVEGSGIMIWSPGSLRSQIKSVLPFSVGDIIRDLRRKDRLGKIFAIYVGPEGAQYNVYFKKSVSLWFEASDIELVEKVA